MTPDALATELARGRVRPAYLVAGEEPLLRDDAVCALRAAVLAGAAADFNLDRLSGTGTTAATLFDALRTLPVFASRRLVWLRDPDSARGGASRALLDALPEAVALAASRDDVVLLVTTAKADKRERWVRASSSQRRSSTARRHATRAASLASCVPRRSGSTAPVTVRRFDRGIGP